MSVIIVMGVSGCGKTTVGRLLADRLGVPFHDADDFHPPANVAKMAAAQPLDDDDRRPWLEALAAGIAQWESEGGAVLACSALKERYRAALRGGSARVRFLHLKGTRETILARMKSRSGHYMPPALLDSQFAALEEPADAIVADVRLAPEAIVAEALWALDEGRAASRDAAKSDEPPKFIHADFLLGGAAARRLYHDFAADQPIVDFHNHLSPTDIADDRQFANLTELWLEGDHYKWRAERANGIDERLITGDASPWEKFEAWAATVPATLRNPLYHWTHLELARPFGIDDVLLGPATARAVWELANARLVEPEFSARGLLRGRGVEWLCTTDDPADDLAAHRRLAADPTVGFRVYPTFRPDRALAIEEPGAFREYLARLGAAADVAIDSYGDLLAALRQRHDAFHALGCRLADHGLAEPFADDFTESDVAATFARALAGETVDPAAARRYKSALLLEFGRWAHERNWTQQYHLGPLRNVSTRLLRRFGPDAGADTIGDRPMAAALARMLDRLDADDRLPRTILYNLNPRDTEVFAAMIGCFQDGRTPGKLQLGAAWWFNDQRDGILAHLDALSNFGLLARFVGMLTDSRSLLSFSRHDYFRRVLCDALGRDIEEGRLPRDFELVGGMVRDICYRNAAAYFGLPAAAIPRSNR